MNVVASRSLSPTAKKLGFERGQILANCFSGSMLSKHVLQSFLSYHQFFQIISLVNIRNLFLGGNVHCQTDHLSFVCFLRICTAHIHPMPLPCKKKSPALSKGYEAHHCPLIIPYLIPYLIRDPSYFPGGFRWDWGGGPLSSHDT